MYFLFSCLLVLLSSNHVQSEGSFYTVNDFADSEKLSPYDWHYMRVELPPWFSAISLQVDPHIDFETREINSTHMVKLPTICFKDGSPPLPDVSNLPLEGMELDHFPNSSFGSLENIQNAERCYRLWKRIRVELTNEQISPGVLVIGLFNGIGPVRTQRKMINRGAAYSFTTNVTVVGCMYQSMRGQYCNQTVEQLLCHQSNAYELGRSLESTKMKNDFDASLVTCNKFSKDSCYRDLDLKVYSLEMVQPAEQLVLSASNFRLNGTTVWNDEVSLMCYARYGVIPSKMSYDYSVDLSRRSLVIPSPKVGFWYFDIQLVNKFNILEGRLYKSVDLCHSMEWEVHQCLEGKAGPNCTWAKYMLQLDQRDNSYASFLHMSNHGGMHLELQNVPLEPLLTNPSSGNKSAFVWTYFVFNITQDSSGKNVHIDLLANMNVSYELYAKSGGLPSTKDWDYFYINQTSNSNNGSMFKLYDSSKRRINAYLLYPREGLWSFGLRHPVLSGNTGLQTNLSISIESCPNQCSGRGTCSSDDDVGGSRFYRNYFCNCDGRYGGFDCSVQLVSQAAYRWHVIFLTASNAAALLPAVWALRQKAFAEWVVFICSGVASTVYHACDTGSRCILSFHVLQFMDFWLSFMAVVSTFIYLAFINGAARRTIQTIAFIITALLAVNGPTKSSNIILVVAFGALGLFVAWLIELFSRYKSNSLSFQFRWNTEHRGSWFANLLKTFKKRFPWCFVLGGFIALSMAALSWNKETIKTYWLWHSAWHVSIYTSAFFFLCSRAAIVDRHSVAVEEAEAETGVTFSASH